MKKLCKIGGVVVIVLGIALGIVLAIIFLNGKCVHDKEKNRFFFGNIQYVVTNISKGRSQMDQMQDCSKIHGNMNLINLEDAVIFKNERANKQSEQGKQIWKMIAGKKYWLRDQPKDDEG